MQGCVSRVKWSNKITLQREWVSWSKPRPGTSLGFLRDFEAAVYVLMGNLKKASLDLREDDRPNS
jgi:hypothetical protein